MPKITPIQSSFAAGEISPLMTMRVDTQGYQQGAAEMVNMIADSRGPAISRSGIAYVDRFAYNDGKTFALPMIDAFFYSGLFFHETLTINSILGHNPSTQYATNPNFLDLSTGWTSVTDGHATSLVEFSSGECTLSVADSSSRYAGISQSITVPSADNYKILWTFSSTVQLTVKVGTASNDGTYYEAAIPPGTNSVVVAIPTTTAHITLLLDSDTSAERQAVVSYFGATTETPAPVSFTTPYQDGELQYLQGVQSPSGNTFYILHENHPPYKLTYDRATDSFSWSAVTFTSPPAEWTGSSYPSTGSFFEGRLWLGGTVNEPQTFWASKSGLPEDFTIGTAADDALQFTLAKYGRIEWIVGFKNLLIGTANGEHIVTSEGGVITPSDIQVNQQSSYGSAGIQPLQVGDQVFYVSPDRRKLRSIQYEWQADNWLSQDLTFTSEHLTLPKIKEIIWQQNPNNIFHCILDDGTSASMTYDRSNKVYGWYRLLTDGVVLSGSSGPVKGTDLYCLLIKRLDGYINFEIQQDPGVNKYMDSWVNRTPSGTTVSGLEHLEGLTVQIQTDGATHPDRVVSSGQITLQSACSEATVGLKYTPKITTLPPDKGSPTGSAKVYEKRYNKLYVELLDSSLPLINGERAPERDPSSPMDVTQPNTNTQVLKIDLGYSKDAVITIEQDLPRKMIVLAIYGELIQEIM